MKKLNQAFIILLIAVGFLKTETIKSQTRFNAAQSTVNFKFTTWNTEWLTCPTYGPTDEELQVNNIVAIIKTLNSDVVALQEVGSSAAYTTMDTIARRLGAEWEGSLIPSSAGNCGQNQGIVYKKSKVQLVSAALISNGGSSYDWSSGRYPVLYHLNLLVGDIQIPVSFINIHAKALSDETSYARRKSASVGLKALLDGSTYNTQKVILLGDFNDYLTGTQCMTCSPNDSPYQNFMIDTENYKCLTNGLYDPAYSNPMIDNIIISNELVENYKQNSVSREVVATQSIFNYTNTTSDHTPVSASFGMTAGAVPSCEGLSFSESFGASLGAFVPYSVAGSQTWNWRQGYGAYTSGYTAGVNSVNEDWLISPAFDLSNRSSATLAFNHALNYCAVPSDIINNQTLWVSTNYTDGAPANSTWTALTIPKMPSGNSWTFVNSGDIQLPTQMLQNNVHFAFKYLSGTAVAGTWEIKDLTLNAECIVTNVSTVVRKSQSKVFALDRQIFVRNQQLESTTIYDVAGRVLFSVPFVQNLEIPVYQSGVYLVRVGNEVSKVIIK